MLAQDIAGRAQRHDLSVAGGIIQFNHTIDTCPGDLAAGDDDRAERPHALVVAIAAGKLHSHPEIAAISFVQRPLPCSNYRSVLPPLLIVPSGLIEHVVAEHGQRPGIGDQRFLVWSEPDRPAGQHPCVPVRLAAGELRVLAHLAGEPVGDGPAPPGRRRQRNDGQARQFQADPGPAKAEDPDNPEAEEFSRDLTMVLTRQHNQVRALLQQLQALPGHKAGGTAEDLAARKSIVGMITVRLARHETAEEQYLWPTVRKAIEDGDDLADQALSQEREGAQTLARLGALEPGTDEFDEGVEQLVAQLRKHVAYEGHVFTRLREAVPDSERERLGRKVEAAAKRAPTRAHAAGRWPAEREGTAG